jgi:predicted nucleic acid-binding protein
MLVLGEIRRRADRLRERDPARARTLQRWLILVVDQFRGRLLHVDRQVAEEWGRIDARAAVPPIGGLLPATVQVKDFTLGTRNGRNIARTGVPHLNPFELLPEEEVLR